MHAAVKRLACFAGATVLGDGRVALILDVDTLVARPAVAPTPTGWPVQPEPLLAAAGMQT